jgi:hypothetical protein
MLFAIVKRDNLEIIGTYESDFKDDSSARRSHLAAEPFCKHIEVPADLHYYKAESKSIQKTSIIIDTPESTNDLGELVPAISHEEITNEVDIVLVHDADKEAKAVVDAKIQLVTIEYNKMNDDVFAEMKRVFGTSNADSANAYYETYKLMASDPGLFVAALNKNEQDIVADANVKIEAIKQYSVYRMIRIAQFQAEKAAILGA